MAGQSMRDIKRRIQSVRNTQQVTKAMEMVSAAKLRRAQMRVMAARPYANKVAEVLGRIVQAMSDPENPLRLDHPLLRRRPVQRVLYCVIAADRGLAGGYNANLIRAFELARAQEQREGRQVQVVAVGRKVRDYLRRSGQSMRAEFLFIGDQPDYQTAQEIARALVEPYAAGEADAVLLLYSQFLSATFSRPVIFPLLPVPEQGPRPWPALTAGMVAAAAAPGPGAEGAAAPGERRGEAATGEGPSARGRAGSGPGRRERWMPPYLYFPSAQEVVGVLLARYVEVEVYRALLEAKAAEHGARMAAMRNASDNAEELIRTLTLSFNRARQASITKEVTEIVTGKEALAQL